MEACSPAGFPPEASSDSLDVVADFCATLDRVQEFVLINYVIVCNVLKYYMKRAGVGTDLEKRLQVCLCRCLRLCLCLCLCPCRLYVWGAAAWAPTRRSACRPSYP